MKMLKKPSMYQKIFENLKKISSEKEENKKNFFSSNLKEDYLYFENFTLLAENEKKSAGNKVLLSEINLNFEKNKIYAIMGPSGAGKSLFLSSITKGIFEAENSKKYHWKGKMVYRGTELLKTTFPMELLSKKMGWIHQTPTLLPLTMSENMLFALSASGLNDSMLLEKMLQEMLKSCALWEELKDSLDTLPMNTLSVGQAQRLCIASALMLEPDLLLLDEPTSSLDPASTAKMEQLILKISKKMTVMMVSHSLSQVKHIADYTMFIKNGKILEFGETKMLFTSPKTQEFQNFILSKY